MSCELWTVKMWTVNCEKPIIRESVRSILKAEIIAVLRICESPNIPPVYKWFGTTNTYTGDENTSASDDFDYTYVTFAEKTDGSLYACGKYVVCR